MNSSPFLELAVSLALGLLVGMQRERTESSVAGVRTFPLITLFGTVCAQLGHAFGGWLPAAGLLATTAVIIMANFARWRGGEFDPGATTEVAAILLYAVGALVVVNTALAVIVGGLTALLLHLKAELHRAVSAIGERDVKAIMQFVVISLVILPVLPNQTFGPYQVLNPFKIWLMVVFIVGLSLSGYVAAKLLGPRQGVLVGGFLGGLISSTATTVSIARQSRTSGAAAALLTTVILLASTVVFARVLGLVATVAPPSFWKMAPPLAAMGGIMLVLAVGGFVFARREKLQPMEPENPAELKGALIFGALYAAILVLIEMARAHFGQSGIYTVAFLSGLADMDAITLSTAQLVNAGQMETTDGWRTILVAALSNLLFKTVVVASLGSRPLLWRVGALFTVGLIFGACILRFWP